MRKIQDVGALKSTWRRSGWMFENLTLRKFANFCLAASEFALKKTTMRALPIVLKIDISPLCNLRCTVCVHAKPDSENYLEDQFFHKSHKMPLEDYRRIVDEIKGKSTAVSLYYMGEPLLHPNLDEMSRIAYDAGLNVHISTNLSLRLSDERIRKLVENGPTHITVAVDGISQETYGKTRINGNINWVLANLQRLCQYKRERGQRYPKIEVQYLTFDYNLNEIDPALKLFKEYGVDQVSVKQGFTVNWASGGLRKFKVDGMKPNKLFPQCIWPHFFMVIKYNGDVIPCCTYREQEQHSKSQDPHVVGNVFQSGVRAIWNSSKYQQMRGLISNPASIGVDAKDESSFCYGCRKVYQLSESPVTITQIPVRMEMKTPEQIPG